MQLYILQLDLFMVLIYNSLNSQYLDAKESTNVSTGASKFQCLVALDCWVFHLRYFINTGTGGRSGMWVHMSHGSI
jgi:hypothetical protein